MGALRSNILPNAAAPADSYDGLNPLSPDEVRPPEAPDRESARELALKYSLDERDIEILALRLSNPRMSTPEIAKKLGLNRSTVWERVNRGSLAHVLRQVQVEMVETTKDLVVVEAVDAIRTLGRLARGEDRNGNPDQYIPYAVQRAAAKDILDVLRGAGLVTGEKEEEAEVWESIITEVGGVAVKRVRGGQNAIPASTQEE